MKTQNTELNALNNSTNSKCSPFICLNYSTRERWLLSDFRNCSQGFGAAPRVLKLLSDFRNFSQGFGVAPRILELLPGFWSCSQDFGNCSQGFGVAPRILELLPGFWRCSQGFEVNWDLLWKVLWKGELDFFSKTNWKWDNL